MGAPSLRTGNGPHRSWRRVYAHNGKVRLHLFKSFLSWDLQHHPYSTAHNLTRAQAFRLGVKLIAMSLGRL